MTCSPRENDTVTCNMLCDSVFFKIWDEEANANFIDNCGTSFNGKYRDITYIRVSIYHLGNITVL